MFKARQSSDVSVGSPGSEPAGDGGGWGQIGEKATQSSGSRQPG